MPQLPIYTAPVGDAPIFGGRRAEGSDFSVADLSGIGRTVREAAGAFAAQTEEDEARRALVASTEIRAKYAKALDDAAVSGAPLAPLQEAMTAELSKVGESFRTKRGVDSLALYTSNVNLMFDEQANAIAVKRAGEIARVEGSKFINAESAVVIRNPSSLAFAEKNVEAFAGTLTGISPGAKALLIDEWKKELNQAAAVASARLDPEGTKKRLEDGEFNLSAGGRQDAISFAERVSSVRKAAVASERAEAERQRRERMQAAETDIIKKVLGRQLTGKALEAALLNNPDIDGNSVRTVMSFVHSREQALRAGEGEGNKAVFRDLFLRATAPDGDPSKLSDNEAIRSALARKQLTTGQAWQLMGIRANDKDEWGRSVEQRLGGELARLKRAMSTAWYGREQQAADIQMTLIGDARDEILRRRQDKEPIGPVFDPKSKDYAFSPERVESAARRIGAQKAPSNGIPQVKDAADLLDKKLNVGDWFVDPNGTRRTVTREILDEAQREASGGRVSTGRIGGR